MKNSQIVIIAENAFFVVDDITQGLLRLVDYDAKNQWAMLFSYAYGEFSLIQTNRTFNKHEIEMLVKRSQPTR